MRVRRFAIAAVALLAPALLAAQEREDRTLLTRPDMWYRVGEPALEERGRRQEANGRVPSADRCARHRPPQRGKAAYQLQASERSVAVAEPAMTLEEREAASLVVELVRK